MPARLALTAVIGCAALAATAGAATPAPPCTPRTTTIHGHRAIVYCGPATVTIQLAGRTYGFANGLCDRSAAMGALVINAGTLVRGAAGNAGRPFVSIVIAQSPSSSEAFEADWGGQQLFGESEIAQGGTLLSTGTFAGILGAAFSGAWDCHGRIYDGP